MDRKIFVIGCGCGCAKLEITKYPDDDDDDFIMSISESLSENNSPICKFCKYEKNVDIPMIKLIGTPSIKFVGGGWSSTNYQKVPQTNKTDTEKNE